MGSELSLLRRGAEQESSYSAEKTSCLEIACRTQINLLQIVSDSLYTSPQPWHFQFLIILYLSCSFVLSCNIFTFTVSITPYNAKNVNTRLWYWRSCNDISSAVVNLNLQVFKNYFLSQLINNAFMDTDLSTFWFVCSLPRPATHSVSAKFDSAWSTSTTLWTSMNPCIYKRSPSMIDSVGPHTVRHQRQYYFKNVALILALSLEASDCKNNSV